MIRQAFKMTRLCVSVRFILPCSHETGQGGEDTIMQTRASFAHTSKPAPINRRITRRRKTMLDKIIEEQAAYYGMTVEEFALATEQLAEAQEQEEAHFMHDVIAYQKEYACDWSDALAACNVD
jgi:hypothetical protein